MKTKKILQFLSRSLAGLLFTAGFFIFFASIFLSGLLENIPVLENSLQENLITEDYLAEQIASSSGLSVLEVKEICKKNPAQEGCEQLNNPSMVSSSLIENIKEQISPYAQLVNNLKILMVLFFALSLIFYFLGTMSIYSAIFKISMNAFLSAVFGYIAFSTLPKTLLGIIEQALSMMSADISQALPEGFREILVKIINEWISLPISNLNKLFIYLAAASLPVSILFYFLKRKKEKK